MFMLQCGGIFAVLTGWFSFSVRFPSSGARKEPFMLWILGVLILGF